MDGDIEHEKGVGDQGYGDIGDTADRFWTVVFVDDIRHNEFQGPQENAAGKVKTKPFLSQQGKRSGVKSQEFFKGEDLSPYTFLDQHICHEKYRETNE